MQNSGDRDETPVFFDRSGARWKYVKIAILLVACLIVALLFWIIPPVLADRHISTFQQKALPGQGQNIPNYRSQSDPRAFALELYRSNTPVIGKGPFVRVVEVVEHTTGNVAVDPFSGKIIDAITAADKQYIDTDRYALQRYGKTDSRRIVLTFDDGPSASYTPKLLDELSRESVQANFFVTGNNVVKYPEIARRIVREGHVIGNHTFSHIDFDYVTQFEAAQQITQTQRAIVVATGHSTGFFRPPYAGSTDQTLRNALVGILTAQRMGYVNTMYDFDSNDWQFSQDKKPVYPTFDGGDKVVLLHDGGGDRSQTITYVKTLVAKAKQNGYQFTTLNALYPQSPALMNPDQATISDNVSFAAAWSVLVFPQEILSGLFILSLAMLISITVLNLILAILHHRRPPYAPLSPDFRPFVTIVVPAYNEGTVIENTVRSLIGSDYKNIEIIIVDDGSTDNTWDVAQRLASMHVGVQAIHQENGGKSSAINNAIRHASGSIIIGVDADTIFPPQTVTKLIRHFIDPRVGAVAGVVRVGNIRDILTLWQALEYSLSIAIERNAHAYLSSIMIVPGACGAWRKSAILEAGGLSRSTLAEDCDLTMSIQRLGKYKILQDNQAISYTEVPQQFHSLMKQRFRWTFGNIQSLFKHRKMLFNERYGNLGTFVMPYSVISIALPLLFWPFLMWIAAENILSGNYTVILLYFVVSMTLQFIFAIIGLTLIKAPYSYLVAVPFARFIYGPIRVYVLYKTIVTAIKGSSVGWNKLARTGTVKYADLRTRLAKHP